MRVCLLAGLLFACAGKHTTPPAPAPHAIADAGAHDATLAGDATAWTADDFAPALAPILCDRAVRCGEIAPAERARCVKDGPRELYGMLHHIHDFYDLHDAVKRHRLVEVPSKLQACLDDARKADCADPKALWSCWHPGHVSSIPVVYDGALAPGKACASSVECRGGYCRSKGNRWDGCAGVCVAYAKEGGACDGYGRTGLCDEDLYCTDEGKCARAGDVGAACVPFRNCKRDLFCQGYQPRIDPCGPDEPCDHDRRFPAGPERLGTCQPRGAVGTACRLFGAYPYDCAAGLWCDGTASPPVCRAPLADGDACAWPGACASGSVCKGVVASGPRGVDTEPTSATRKGVCTRIADLGGACDPTSTEPGCAAFDWCDPATKTCVASGDAGTKCDVDGHDCATGLYCDGWTHTCTKQAGAGDSCKPYPPAGGVDPCLDGSCDHDAKTCVQYCD